MYNRRFTPEMISSLDANEIFVFGSNLAGQHGGGAARAARLYFGAVMGEGVGLQGQSYAIPTMHGGVEAIRPYVDEFVAFAAAHKELTFLVTKIGCGIAGFVVSDIAPLFAAAIDMENVILPKEFVDVIEDMSPKTPVGKPSWRANEDFLDKYTPLMQKVAEGNMRSYTSVKKLRVEEFMNTVDIVKQGYYITESGERVEIKGTDYIVANAEFYDSEFRVDDVPTIDGKTIVEVVNDDCMAVGMRLVDEGYNPAVLNMASRRNPGGGVISGAGAQEETIFRRTNIHPSLYQFASYAEDYGVAKSPLQYPLERNYGGAYSPCVTIFRGDEKSGYRLLSESETRQLAFVSVAAISRPDLTDDGLLVPKIAESTKTKIRIILRIGLKHGHDSLVLGALGCGAFRNPPHHIAKLFHEVIDEVEFANKYKRLVFAILDDHNAHREHNREGNFLPFAREFAVE
jgi:uncharacterized protein (TIGR02452 family)